MRLLKTSLAVLTISALGLSSVALADSATLNKIKETNTILLGHRESSVPFSYYDNNQNVIGYSQEIEMKIVNAIKAKLNLPDLKTKMLPVTSANRITLLQNGSIDIECGSTTHNKERAQQVGFSNTIFIIGTRLMTKNNSGIKDFPDLAGKNVVTTAGTTSERILQKMDNDKDMNMNIISAKDHGEAFLMLQSGRAVAFMMDDALLFGERAKARNPEDWVVVGKPQSYEAYGCIVRKDDPEFKAIADETIAKLMTSGEINTIYDKWFNKPIPPKNLNLEFPLSEKMQALFKAPNDKPFE
ncbi:glutamate/aspartate ABC transporter substrate-binding protein [Entomomonas asaccharolytica]|uniref:Glutamate/aspartate ABC transporter substrate-binding protein n=1 Tax=Entomomonas asaccharolytica TaxID=2785331 RepID=A0A974NGX6_9GAMM|nr:glutamate/aspartate ABC transporter substrate-binding protein [Entomomonas asaccharolytica]QQP86177.1 glutamate/aspartate ABC transporter substrate-binding protein [Entomomonas asaccharolytica]